MNWTPAQEKAIKVCGGDIAVSAGAGAGKTAVLTARCLRLILEGIPIDKLLVITFTESAAHELKSRIEEELRRISAGRGDDCAGSQLLLLGRSWISTIHAFCLRVLRENAVVAGVSPYMRVPDAEEVFLTNSEIAEEVLEEFLDEDEHFHSLIDDYADGNINVFLELVRSVSSLVDSVPDPQLWIAEKQEIFAKGIFPGEEFLSHVKEKLKRVCEESLEAESLLRSRFNGIFAPWADYLDESRSVFKRMLTECKTFSDLHKELSGFSFQRLPSIKGIKDLSGGEKKDAKRLVDSVRDEVKKRILPVYLSQTEEQLMDGEKRVAWYGEAFFKFLSRYRERVLKDRKVRDVLAFSDFEHRLHELLSGSGKGSEEVVKRLKDHFYEIFVDEFQDVNSMQDRLLDLVRRSEPGNLFVVGDLKQSIYRFRLTDPSIFAKRIKMVQGASPERFVSLQENFRSREELLKIIDRIFSFLMTDRLDGIGFDKTSFSRAGRKEPVPDSTFGNPFVEFHLVDAKGEVEDDPLGDFDRTEKEAMLVASRLIALKEKGFYLANDKEVLDQDGSRNKDMRKFSWGDCAILFRALKGRLDVYLRVFSELGIPVVCPSGGDPFKSIEIRDLMSLLRVLDNPRQDLPLAALMHSPFGGFSMEEIALIRAGSGLDLAFYNNVLDGDMPGGELSGKAGEKLCEKLFKFREKIGAWRKDVRNSNLSESLWKIITGSGYFAFLASLPQGSRRKANVLALMERARQFSSFDRQGLFRFLHFIEDLAARSGQLGTLETVEDPGDAVTILSIHKSKGLEWPVVVLPDLGRRFNMQGLRRRILPDKEFGLGFRVVDSEAQIHYPTARYLLLSAKKKQELLAEELRILYVAFTRAKEKLLLVGTGDIEKLKLSFSFKDVVEQIPPYALLKAQTSLDWLCRAFGRLQGTGLGINTENEICNVIFHDKVPAVTRVKTEKTKPGNFKDSENIESLSRILKRKYQFGEETKKKAVFHVTELSQPGRFQEVTIGGGQEVTIGGGDHGSGKSVVAGKKSGIVKKIDTDEIEYLPEFLKKSAESEGKQRGIVNHLFLQHMNLENIDFTAEFERLAEKSVFKLKDKELLDFKALKWFFGTSLGIEIRRNPGDVRREVPFIVRVGKIGLPVLLRGVVDGVLCKDKFLKVYDFKTDRISRQDISERAAKYRLQLVAYCWALQKIWKKPVSEAYLVFLSARKLFKIPGDMDNISFLWSELSGSFPTNRGR